MENTKTLGVDLGGTNLRVGVIDAEGQIIVEENRSTEIDKGPDYVIQQMVDMIRELKENHKIERIGIGSPGPF